MVQSYSEKGIEQSREVDGGRNLGGRELVAMQKKGRIRYGRRRKRCKEGQKFGQRFVVMGDGELGDSNQKVPETRKARASQYPTGMILAEIPHKEEGEHVKTRG